MISAPISGSMIAITLLSFFRLRSQLAGRVANTRIRIQVESKSRGCGAKEYLACVVGRLTHYLVLVEIMNAKCFVASLFALTLSAVGGCDPADSADETEPRTCAETVDLVVEHCSLEQTVEDDVEHFSAVIECADPYLPEDDVELERAVTNRLRGLAFGSERGESECDGYDETL